ncbi:MAG TPA: MFS transporter [Oscillospiraceae bacterium]|nr:MFS transporter [Oscillospiraceae bacterium]
MGSSLNPINTTLLTTALVPIANFMNISVAQTTILVTVLYLACTVTQPTAGKLSEVLGPRRVFLGGIIILFLGGLVGGFGQNLTMLIISRVLIGIGTSTAYPSSMMIIRQRAESGGLSEPPGSVLGSLQIAALITSIIGLPIGGALVQFVGWRMTFLVNIPFSLVAFIITILWIPRDVPANGAKSFAQIFSSIDGIGILGFAGTMISLLIFLFSLPNFAWIPLILTVIFGAASILWELHVKRPFIDVRLLIKNMAITRTYIRFSVLNLCCYAILYGLTEWMQAAKGMSSSNAGLLMLPMVIVSTVVALLLSRKNMVRGSLFIAAGFAIAASVCALFLSTASSVIFIVLITILFGVTMGSMIIGNQAAIYKLSTADQLGIASGLFRTSGYLGSIAATAIISIVFRKTVSDSGLNVISIIMLAVSVLALILTVTDRWVMGYSKSSNANN